MMPGLKLETYAGEAIEKVAREAQQIADTVQRPVGFCFNSVRCVAQPGGTAEKLASMQQEAQNSQLVVYSNGSEIEIERRYKA